MRKLSPAELERAQVEKASRAIIRLKHSLAADREINSVLPDRLDEFDTALAQGELLQLKAGLADVLELGD